MRTAVPCYAAHCMFKLSNSGSFFFRNGIFSSTRNRLCYIHRSSLCVIRFKSWSQIVDSTLSPASVPQEPLGWVALLQFPVFFSLPVFSCDPRAVCKAEQWRKDSLRWDDRLIAFNELFWHCVVLLSLFADQSYLTLPICSLQLGLRSSLACICASVENLCVCVCIYPCLCASVSVCALCDHRGRQAGWHN